MELVDLVNSVIIFLSQMVNVSTWIPDCDSYNSVLLDFFFSSGPSISSMVAFPSSGNSDHVIVTVSNDFLSNSKQDAQFHHISCDYSCADWDGLCDNLRDVPW